MLTVPVEDDLLTLPEVLVDLLPVPVEEDLLTDPETKPELV